MKIIQVTRKEQPQCAVCGAHRFVLQWTKTGVSVWACRRHRKEAFSATNPMGGTE